MKKEKTRFGRDPPKKKGTTMKLHSKYYFPLTVNVIEYDDFGTIDYSDEGCEYDGSCAQTYEKEIKEFFEQYTQGDEDMVTYFRDRGNKLLSMKWGFEDRKEQLFGVVDVTHTEVLSEKEVSAIKDYILGQNSDGLGEGFEQQDIEIDDGIINVHFWSSDDAYRIYTEDEFDEFIEQSKEYELKEEKLYGISDNTEKELYSLEDVAEFICKEGVNSDVSIYKTDGSLLLNTFGTFINKITDMNYRERLLEVLVPMQRTLEDNMSSDDEAMTIGGI